MDESEAQFYDEDEDEEMPATERDLADDAQWKIIQKNTFSRWANEHLKTVNKVLNDLETDLSDGLRLIALVEVLSGKSFKKINKRPNFRTQKLENVTMVLEFLERDEGIRIVNIDSTDIVDSKLKLILGLIWTLILHYSISMPMWEGEEPGPSEGGPTPKQRLLNWVQGKVPDLPIRNFTTDWNDGKAIGALVDAVGPGLCPDWDKWEPKKKKENTKEAMDAAEKWLGVPQLLEPKDMINPKVDELSMMTYLSQFPKAQLKPGAPLRPRLNPNRVRAYGPGLEPTGNQVGAPARFTVETFSAGKGTLEVVLLNPKGQKETCECVFNNDRNLTYSCVYTPKTEGEYRVIIKFGDKEIPKSPFCVKVEGAAGDASKVTATGPGIQKTGVVAGKRTYFEVFTKNAGGSKLVGKDAGKGNVDVVILDSHGRKDTVRASIQPVAGKEATYLVEYVPLEPGQHSVNIYFAGHQIPHSPYGVGVAPAGTKVAPGAAPPPVGKGPAGKQPPGKQQPPAPASNAKMCYATGRGVQPTGVRIKDNATFKVHTKGAGTAELKIQIIQPGGAELKCTSVKSKTEDGVWECCYIPTIKGQYIINITYGEQHITKSPFKVEVGPTKVSKIRAYGPGLEGGVVNQPATFTVETNGETGALGFSIEGPSQCKIDCKDHNDGSADVTYYPKAEGEYAVHVLCNKEDIPQSPFMVPIKPATKEFDASKVIAKGPGLEKTGVKVSTWAEFTVDAKKAGKAPLKISCLDVDLKPVEVQIKDNKDGTYSCKYMTKRAVKHVITITWGGVQIPNSPFRVMVGEQSKPGNVKVYGPGVEKGVKTGVKTHFVVDCKTAGPGDVSIALTDERGRDVPVKTVDNKDGTFRIEYEPKTPGTYVVQVYFANSEIPKSPIKVNVESSIDLSKVKVVGLDTPMRVNEPRQVDIITKDCGKSPTPATLSVLSPTKKKRDIPVKETPQGYTANLTMLEPGLHKVTVTYAAKEVPKSPFSVNVTPDLAAKVKAYGPGLKGGKAHQPCTFTVDTREATAPGGLGVTIDGPKEAKIDCVDNGDGTCNFTYVPEVEGEYRVNITYAEQPIPNSPFKAKILPGPKVDATKVKVVGLDKPIKVGEVRPVDIITTSAGKADQPAKMSVMSPSGKKKDVPVKETPQGYTAQFSVQEPGPHKVNVTYDNKEVPKSPFTVNAVPDLSSKVKAYGPGLKGGKAHQPCTFTVDTREATAPGGLGVSVEGPKEAKIECLDNGDGTCNFTYFPEVEGEYSVNVTYAEQSIPNSPFKVKINPGPKIDVSKVNVLGLDKPMKVKEPRQVDIVTTAAGKSDTPAKLSVISPSGATKEVPVKETPQGYTAAVTMLEPGPHKVKVDYNGKEVPKSPFTVDVQPEVADGVNAYGPGLEGGKSNQPCTFTVDTRQATTPGGLGVTVEGPKEAKIDCVDNGDGTCNFTYMPVEEGEYKVNISYADQPIKNSPFTAKIQPGPKMDLSGVKAYGPGLNPDGVFLESLSEFTVDAKSVSPVGEGNIRAIITSPSGTKHDSIVTNKKDGTYNVLYTPEEQGPTTIDVTYDNMAIPKSPFKVNTVPGNDASKVKAYGPGLEGGYSCDTQQFTVDVKNAGQGGIGLAINGPVEAQINCNDNRDGTLTVDYLPTKPGDYDVNISFADQPIPGSPFNVSIKNPVNPAKVQCYGPGLDSKGVREGSPATFTVDTTEAGEAPLEVTYTDSQGNKRPADIQPVSEGKVNATYYPQEEGKCKVEVKYADQQVPGSPFAMQVQPTCDASRVMVTGSGVGPNVHASKPVTFTIDTSQAGMGDLEVTIMRPDGSFITPVVQDNGDGTFTVSYIPDDLGQYKINVKFGGKNVPNSPFKVKACPTGDASKCRITEGLDNKFVPINKETVITVDASQAGDGKVTCRIRSPSGNDIDIDIVENPDGTFSLLFTPQLAGAYTINIKFGGQTVPGGEYDIQAVEPHEYEDYLQQQQVGEVEEQLLSADTVDNVQASVPVQGLFQPVDFRIPVGPIFNFVSAYVIMPSGEKAYPKIEDNKDGTVTVKYQPTDTGLHELHVNYNSVPIDGSPFQFHVDAVNSGHVTAYGPGLCHGVVNEPAEFTIVTKDAGAGGLSLAIEGPSKTEIKCQDNGNGTCTVSYIPTAPGEYNITCKFADQHISGSPFTAKITPSTEVRKRAQIGRSTEVSLKVTESDIGSLMATIRTPSGTEEPCLLKRLANGHLGISFTPHEVGEHLVNVFRNGTHINGSPFKIYVGESELGNASKVRCSGPGLQTGMANEINEFTLDTTDAGYGGLSLSIEGPSKADIECLENDDGTCRVTYKPTEPGNYVINIKFADEQVPGSPYTVKIGGESSSRITERITRHREAADITHIGSQCELSLKIPVQYFAKRGAFRILETHVTKGTSPFDMTASVTSPTGVTELCDIISLDDSHYSIKFVPKEMGVHTVCVKHKDMHIPGSPFEFTVGPIAGGGSHKVHAAGPGLEKGEINQPCEFNIYTREAGAGGLSIAVEGPSKSELDFDDRKDGSCGVSYTVTEPGEYMVSIKFNDEHIPQSPYRVYITPSIGDARKLSVSALQSKGAGIGKPCSFVIHFNGAQPGKVKATVLSPSGAEEEAFIQEIDEGEYAVRFMPRENGPHMVFVSYDGCQIPESPFRIMIGKVDADPGMVNVSGEGLRSGTTGEPAKFFVNTCNAGSGALAVTVEGPSKVKLECKETEEGYEFTYKPTSPGDYLISIRYAGSYVAGSPFKAKITGQGKVSNMQELSTCLVETVTKTSVMSRFTNLPKFQSDASNVTCEGNGMKKAFRGKQSTFTIDTTMAGNNILYVGMVGPKGPCEELCVKHQGGGIYKINYIVKEMGEYMLVVKWGPDNIPGSPFCVKVT
ncbi:filamin-A-like isoform X2 [Argopecten irradians]|uniref:filamin-A-like isoform X2 n=1 Tax=Argopecten irradians TaxID=31199 RepID=UPI0037195946